MVYILFNDLQTFQNQKIFFSYEQKWTSFNFFFFFFFFYPPPRKNQFPEKIATGNEKLIYYENWKQCKVIKKDKSYNSSRFFTKIWKKLWLLFYYVEYLLVL